MADYKLKAGQERFKVVDGPFENREYLPGNVYQDIPPSEADKFEQVVSEPVIQKQTKKTVEAAE